MAKKNARTPEQIARRQANQALKRQRQMEINQAKAAAKHQRQLARIGAPSGNPESVEGIYSSATGSFDISGILAHLQAVQQRARDENLRRDAEQIEAIRTGYASAFDEIQSLGDTALRDIDRREQDDLAYSEIDAVDRGLGNSSYLDALRERVRERTERSRQDVRSQVSEQRAGLFERQGHAMSQAISARTDAYPDTGSYLALAAELESRNAAERERRRQEEERRRQEEELARPQHYVIA